eukprot:NODE_25941_length_570_cov_2.139955.p4 GENE.NODE_25941_length_570_cov_2.139955~~NODE_25941_length_570_cov_2.139955.p4  ORF type:complete len:51 (+),score=10.78 NODE_25941_length_570_cov_2.139955:299-451(+)
MREVPCQEQQLAVERCYTSPPGGDQLMCAPAVEAYSRCARAESGKGLAVE